MRAKSTLDCVGLVSRRGGRAEEAFVAGLDVSSEEQRGRWRQLEIREFRGQIVDPRQRRFKRLRTGRSKAQVLERRGREREREREEEEG